jgi:hypothetical protein
MFVEGGLTLIINVNIIDEVVSLTCHLLPSDNAVSHSIMYDKHIPYTKNDPNTAQIFVIFVTILGRKKEIFFQN